MVTHVDTERLRRQRPPCSEAERRAAEEVYAQLRPIVRDDIRAEPFRSPTSPVWAPLGRALCRLWAAAFLAARSPVASLVLSAIAVAGGAGALAGLVRHLPAMGGVSVNVAARVRGLGRARPLVVVAHLDNHPTLGEPLQPLHRALAATSGFALVAAGIAALSGGVRTWSAIATLAGLEAIVTIAWLARSELRRDPVEADDNASGLMTLMRTARLVTGERPTRDVWLVATGAATVGGHGMGAFLRTHPELARRAWVVEIDALGAGEIVASVPRPRPLGRRTPRELVRAVATAARLAEDPMPVRRVHRPHSDARVALAYGTPGVTLTGGLRPPEDRDEPDPANAERAARVVDRLARTVP